MTAFIGRREFITLVGGATAAWPLAAGAQQSIPAIGFLGFTSPEEFSREVAAFHRGLSELGYVQGQNVTIEFRWAHGRYDRLSALAAELVALKVDLILAS